MLLVDAGNTLVKWAIVEGQTWWADGALSHDDVSQLVRLAIEPYKPSRAVCVSVAGDLISHTVTETLARAGLKAEWFGSSPTCCGVRNGYEHPEQLGADRWAALIGARALHDSACLVVCAGTATTMDLLGEDGYFQGGVILPGERLMRQALANNTAQLPFASGRHVARPRNTMDAIVSGCGHAQIGAVERMFKLISDRPRALCLLTGGAAGTLEAHLSIPLRRFENLVLHGLAVAATTHACLRTDTMR